ncbi:MAG: class I SAM-dependent methyltransferase [Nanoarchaeota archaeon]|nr:class I SAM-dependent methyltransferase [Nanoarchaeota archaeon]MBU4116568.1 class I SAM-dependent methyltransferase [Nanoarchaeota archaeon]
MKNIEYWEKILKNPPNSYKKWFEKEKKYLQKNITKNSKVLEVGCGEGRSLKDILPLTKNITGIDYDKKAVNDAKKNFKDFPKIKILKADAHKLPFKNKSFDFVICMTTFANFGNKKYIVLKEMNRVLKDKGFIIISVFSEDALKERMKVYKKHKVKIKKINNGKVIFDKSEKMLDYISEQFSKNELKKIFNKTNLKIIEIKKIGIAYICKLKK